MKHLILLIVISLSSFNLNASTIGCNFAVTNSTTVGATVSFTVGQGPWGHRKYTWNFGDGTSNISYSTPTNSVYMTHTYSMNGVYSMTINAQDSLGGGCLAYMIYNVSITGASPTCQAQFTYSVDTVNCKIQYTNQSSGATSYLWMFSNGVNSAATNPSVTIVNASAITATLNAYSSGQLCGTDTLSVGLANGKCYSVGIKKYDDNVILRQKNESGEIELQFGNLIFNFLSIADTRGIVAKKIKITSSPVLVDITELQPGVYYLFLNGLNGTVTKKVIK